MKKLTALLLALCLILLCGCTANKAELTAAKESGAAGMWYCNLFGRMTQLTLNEDLTCSMEIEGDRYDYRGTWSVSDGILSLRLDASSGSWLTNVSMDVTTFSVSADALTCTVDGAEYLSFTREIPSVIESAPVRTDTVHEDFIGVWNVDMIRLNGIILAVNGLPLPPSDFGADMSISIGTTSAAVETAAEPDTVYLFPASFENGVLTLSLGDMVMVLRLLEDGTMILDGTTPLHKTVFTEDAPLTLYLSLEKEDLG